MFFDKTRWFAAPKYRFEPGDEMALADLGTLVLPFRREHLLRYLPAKGAVAEIGVARGNFSKHIIAKTEPSYLALVDAWDHQDEAIYTKDGNNEKLEIQLARWRSAQRRFARASGSRKCDVVRAYSDAAAKTFPDQRFDWVYVDANHSYEACLEDLRAWGPKVKADGFICGHDFAHHVSAQNRFGVVEAVFAYVEETGAHLIAMTVEHFPTFVIAKDIASENAKRFLKLLYSFEPHLISVSPEAVKKFRHARILDNGQKRAAIVNFSR